MESNDSPEIPDRGETSDIPGLPSGVHCYGESALLSSDEGVKWGEGEGEGRSGEQSV